MEKVGNIFPFRKLKQNTYAFLDVMMYIERSKALKFMFCVNKEARTFLQHYFITVRNQFINDGLIIYDLNCTFNDYE